MSYVLGQPATGKLLRFVANVVFAGQHIRHMFRRIFPYRLGALVNEVVEDQRKRPGISLHAGPGGGLKVARLHP